MRENPYVVALSEYPVIASGKVRQLHAVDDDHLLLVASDRISAYDHVLDTPIPDKGRVLTAMSVFWFELLADLVSTHFVTADDARVPDEVRGRALLVRRLSMLPVECVARGYLTGSGLAEYRETGRVCGVTLPSGLTEASRLPEPIFTPTTKAEVGEHDEHIGMAEVASKVGDDLADELRTITLGLYQRAAEHAADRGVLLADTKFEFGLNERGEPVLADEVCTPDSSRYWPADDYAPGQTQSSFDKQYVRDWLSSAASGWDRTSGVAPPALPEAVVRATRERYVEAYERITGRAFADWLRPLG